MSCRNFELIPIKIEFFVNFKSCFKSQACFLAHLACFVGNPDIHVGNYKRLRITNTH